MTPTAWVAIGSALVALLGVLLGLWLGQKRWKVEQAQKERSAYEENLKATYLELWDVVEDVHIKMRTALHGLTPDEFGGFIADVNNFMIRRGLFIHRTDRFLVLEYLFWTNEFLRRIVASNGGRAYLLTSMIHTDMAPTLNEMDQIGSKADELRGRLRSRIQEVVGAQDSGGWEPDERPSDDLRQKMERLVAEIAESRKGALGPAVQDPDVYDTSTSNLDWI